MVLDTQAPDLMCAADITIECDESTDPANTGVSTATDECSDVTVTYQDATDYRRTLCPANSKKMEGN